MAGKSLSEPVQHNSLGLEALLQRLQGVETCSILELGPVRSGNIAFWSQFNPFIYVADLRSSLPLLTAVSENTEGAEAEETDWNQLLGLPEGRRYDIILAWDLLNYLDLPSVSALIRHLGCFCKPGATLFTLIFDQKEMPEDITVYRILDASHLGYEFGRSKMRICPRHQPRSLASVMRQFRVANSFRLRNGIGEYLFVYEGESPAAVA
jgi:hypothetical protein